MKRIVIVLAIVLAATPFMTRAQVTDSVAADKWSLKQCIDYALANSLSVKRSTYNVETSKVDLREAELSRLPSVNASASYGASWGRGLDPVTNNFVTQEITSSNIAAQGSLPLFNGLRIHSNIKRFEKSYAASEQDLAKAKNDIIINVATLFINVVFSKELVENAKLQLASSQQQYERTKKQVAAGALARSEELNLDAQVATNEVNLVQQENALALAILQLKQALQIPASQALDVEIPQLEPEDLLLDQSRDDVYNIARQVMPEIKAAALKIESSDYAVKAARGNLYPRLNLVGTINTNYSSIVSPQFVADGTVYVTDRVIGYLNGDPASPILGIAPNGTTEKYPAMDQFQDNVYRTLAFQLNIPIFNSYSSRANLRRSVIQRQLAQVNADEAANILRQDVETAYNNALAASKSYNANTRQVQSREEAFRMTNQRYANGAVNYVEYQVAENDLFRAKSDLLRAKYEFIFRKKVLDLYQGKPIY